MAVLQEMTEALGQGLRPSDFEFNINEIVGIADILGVGLPIETISRNMVLVKGASQPAEAINRTELLFKGHKINLSGSRQYDDYSITCYNDPKLILKTFFSAWMDANSSFDVDGNLILRGLTTDLTLVQYDTEHNVIGGWVFYNAFPINVDAVDNTSEDSDSVQEYGVTFAYSSHRFIPYDGIKDILENMGAFFDSISNVRPDNLI